MPRLCICLLTYTGGETRTDEHQRFNYACQTLNSTLKHIKTSLPTHVHIAHDGSPPEHIEWLSKIAMNYGYARPSVSNSERRGYGANYNAATLITHDFEYILPLEDDWELVRELDVGLMVDWLQGACREGTRYNSVRLGYLGSTQPVRGTVIHGPGGSMLELDPASHELHVFSGHPRIDTKEYQRRIGFWPEGTTPGEAEVAVSQRKEARQGILWPMDYVRTTGDLFVHIGAVKASIDGIRSGEGVAL